MDAETTEYTPPTGVAPNPEYDMACATGRATFAQVAQAYLGMFEQFQADEPTREMCIAYYPALLKAFEAGNGEILQTIWGSSAALGGARTRAPRSGGRVGRKDTGLIHSATMSSDVTDAAQIDRLERRSLDLDRRARRELSAAEAYQYQDRVWDQYTWVVAIAESRAQGTDSTDLETALDEEVANAQKDLDDLVASSQARQYLLGVLLGSVTVLPVILGLLFLGLLALAIPHFSRAAPCAAAFAGGIGASISVLSRVTFGRFRSPTGTRFSITVGGMARPVVGAVFGIALFSLVEGGILPLDVPHADARRIFFYAALGFLAGFSERFAEDQLGAATALLKRTGAAQAKDATGTQPAATETPAAATETPPAADAGGDDSVSRSVSR